MKRLKFWAKWFGIPLLVMLILFILLIISLSSGDTGLEAALAREPETEQRMSAASARLYDVPAQTPPAVPAVKLAAVNDSLMSLADKMLRASPESQKLLHNAFNLSGFGPETFGSGVETQSLYYISSRDSESESPDAPDTLAAGGGAISFTRLREIFKKKQRQEWMEFPVTEVPADFHAVLDQLEDELFTKGFPPLDAGSMPLGLHTQNWALFPAAQWVILRKYARGEQDAADEYLRVYARHAAALEIARFPARVEEPMLYVMGFLMILHERGFLREQVLADVQRIFTSAALTKEEEEALRRTRIVRQTDTIKKDIRLVTGNQDMPESVSFGTRILFWKAYQKGWDRWAAAIIERDAKRARSEITRLHFVMNMMDLTFTLETRLEDFRGLGLPDDAQIILRQLSSRTPNDFLNTGAFLAAAMRYQLKNGEWPRERATLVPEFLGENEATGTMENRTVLSVNGRTCVARVFPIWSSAEWIEARDIALRGEVPSEEVLAKYRAVLDSKPPLIWLEGFFIHDPEFGKHLIRMVEEK